MLRKYKIHQSLISPFPRFAQKVNSSISMRSFCSSPSESSSPSYLNIMEFNALKAKAEPLVEVLKKEIDAEGPISFARYMELAMTHDPHGYYMKQDVFNSQGDFITSPEISQAFSELIGVWAIYFFQSSGYIFEDGSRNVKLSFLEFGPGKGTMMMNIIRTLGQLGQLHDLDFHFVEASPFLGEQQQDLIVDILKKHGVYMIKEQRSYSKRASKDIEERQQEEAEQEQLSQRVHFYSESGANITLSWYTSYEAFISKNFESMALQTLSQTREISPFFVLCHEFFDAMPAFIFEYTDFGWVERLVDVEREVKLGNNFRWVHSEPFSESVKKILNPDIAFKDKKIQASLKPGDRVEVAPKSLILSNSIGELLQKVDGCMLAVDYGAEHHFSDSLRGIGSHKFATEDQILEVPGEIDLSTYVNFKAISESMRQIDDMARPVTITQGDFLTRMGIIQRADVLKSAPGVDQRLLDSQIQRLVSKDEMGETFKFMYASTKKNGVPFPFDQEGEQVYE